VGLKISIHKKARTVVGIEQQSHMWPYLAISALLFASSAIWFSSLYPAFSGNILASGACSPWRVLCACAHFSSLSSLPKSFFLVNAIYKKTMHVNHTRYPTLQHTPGTMHIISWLPFAQWPDPMLSHSEHIGWGTWWYRAGSRRWCCKATQYQPSPTQCLWLKWMPSQRTQQSA